MKELKVGERITLEAVEQYGCRGCFFDEISSTINIDICNRIKCTSNERKDKKNVQFKRVK